MSRTYYTLAVRDYPAAGVINRKWSAEFGDYDRETVEYEREEYRRNYPANCLRIIRTNGTQAAINAAIAKLNGGE